jgi:hypothetical protein
VYDIALSFAASDGSIITRQTKARVTGAAVHDRVLQIVGTSGSDAVKIVADGEFIVVQAAFLPGPDHTRRFRAADFDFIAVLTGEGENSVEVGEGIAQPVLTDGAIRADSPAGGGPGSAGRDARPRGAAIPGEPAHALGQGARAGDSLAGGADRRAEQAVSTPAINWAGSYAAGAAAARMAPSTRLSGPGLVEFAVTQTPPSDVTADSLEAHLPVTVLALDALGKFLGPQLGNGTGQKKNGNGRR